MEKIEESIQYLKGASSIETQTFKLYETLSKKVNHPESSYILSFGYDSIKNAKILQSIIQTVDLPPENNEAKKNVSLLASEVYTFSRKIEKINSIDNSTLIEIFKELIHLEDLVSNLYTEYLESSYLKVLINEMSELVAMDFDSFKKIFECFIAEKQRHRETIIEIVYCLEAKEAGRLKTSTPVVKYQNPDSWVNHSTLNAFSNSNY
jgi:hypothetical protein